MQSARSTTLKLNRPLKQSLKRLTSRQQQQTRKMSFFPGTFLASPSSHNNNTSFHPLFRLLDDFEQHSRNSSDTSTSEGHPRRSIMKSFTPKFDVKELSDAYELHGDLPGIEQKDIEIEFTDVQTINIRGRTERSYTSGTPPSGFIEGSSPQNTIEGSEHNSKPAPRKASVEDEDAVMVTDPANNSTEVATTNQNNGNKDVSKQTTKEEEPKAKYWVSERSVGEFSRSFTFPVRVDQEAVTASMKNGVLTITVPKAKKHAAKKISITAH